VQGFEPGCSLAPAQAVVAQRPSALALEQAIHDRLPHRALLDILTRTAYLLGWHRHFRAGVRVGPEDPRRDGPVRADRVRARHPARADAGRRTHARPGQRARADVDRNKHTNAGKIDKACTVVVNAFNQLDVAGVWGAGKVVAADGSQVDTWEDNLLAETSIRYGGYGGIAYRHISNTYIALFSHFIPCGA
jgi:hypothetical protein